MPEVITNNLDLWTSALLTKSTAGRGSNGRLEAYGIKKLRELILELAVRGKLVPQDPNDEPASELLKRIQAEKAELIAAGKIKKDKPLPPITDEQKLFNLPSGWAYSNLGDVVEIVRGITFPGNEKSKIPAKGRIACLRTSNVQDQIEWDDILYIREEFVSREDQLLKPRDIVMSMANSRELVGKVALVGEKVNQKTSFGGFLGVLRPFLIDPRFVMTLLRTPHTREMLIDSASQTTNIANVSLAKLRPLFFAIPPLAEQHRIVAKVEELMALCDQLEQQQTHSLEAHQTLVETVLAALVRPTAMDGGSEENAGAIFFNHFDTLFTTEHSIDQLKQTILQLAVMGKLVSQDPNDEPASVLLARIAEQKERLVEKGKIKKQKPLPAIDEEERFFGCPEGWEWCRLQEIVYLLGDGLHGTPEYTPKERFYFVNGNNLSDGRIVIKPETKTVAQDQYEKYKKPLGENSVLVSINGTLGNVAFYNKEEIVLGKSACFFNLSEDIYKRFMKVVIDAPSFADYAYRNATGTTIKNLGLSAMNSLPIALPPKEEQHRIVAEVDELMVLCDALKARLADAQITKMYLADAIVEQAVA